MQRNKLDYPFDLLPSIEHTGYEYISKKLAKVLIIKFLKRECIFSQMMTECMLYHPHLQTVNDVIENMVKDRPYLCDCLFYSERTFSWSKARMYHIENKDGYWGKLKRKWVEAIGTNFTLIVGD